MKAHLVGGGIASLAAAAYLFKEGDLLANNIHIYEVSEILGGALDASGDAESGYTMRGGRMFEEHDPCMHGLLSFIPSRRDPSISVDEELREFSRSYSWYNKSRLVGKSGRAIDFSKLGLSNRNILDLTELLLKPEPLLDDKTIEDCLDLSILTTNFWYMFGSIFAFLPWHSAIELRRYLLRFFHLLPTMGSMSTIQRTRTNQYEAIVLPLTEWLQKLGVKFHTRALVTDIEFLPDERRITANRLRVIEGGVQRQIEVAPDDLVFVTNGSHVAGASRGTMSMAPPPPRREDDKNWLLWKRLARGRKGFGNPAAFNADPAQSGWVTFTMTSHGPLLRGLMDTLTGSAPGRGGLITLTDSSWLVTINSFHNPHFANQPPDVDVWWGYGLYLDRPGDFVAKKMPDCNGAELIEEVVGHLGFQGQLKAILGSTTCIPCLLPYAGSVLLKRNCTDRPSIVPAGSENFAFIGQFAEVADEAVFTTEYAVRTAREAIAVLLKTNRQPPPVFKGQFNPKIFAAAVKAFAS